MVTNYYNASNNFSAPIRREPKPFHITANFKEKEKLPVEQKNKVREIDGDTALLIGLVLLLLLSECDDTILLLALAYLLLF